MPYAYGANINHVFDVDHLNIWVTFKHPMLRSSNPTAVPPVYDIKPPLNKWFLECDSVEVDIVDSAWQDEFTILLTSDTVDEQPDTVTLEYAGPDEHLCTKWYKQWEPWGPLLSTDITSGPPSNAYPQRATMWHDEATVISGEALSIIWSQSYPYTVLSYQNPPADGDSFSNSFFIKAGTYTFSY